MKIEQAKCLFVGRLKVSGFNERFETIIKLHNEENIPIYHIEAAYELLNS